MNTFLKSAVLAILLSPSASIFAQDEAPVAPKIARAGSGEDIVIHKKGKSTEKLTIVVEGDKVTVNGKPVEDFKSDNVDVYKNKTGDSWGNSFSFTTPPVASGDWNMFKNNFGRDIKSNKALLGVMTEKTDEGAKITDVTNESAADKAGLKEGDIITKLGDEKIGDGDDLYKAVGKYKPEDKVTVTYKRDGKEGTATVTLQKNKELHIYGLGSNNAFNLKVAPDVRSYSFYRGKPKMGLQVQDTEDGKGVKVLNVEDESPAEKAGIEEDDIITKVNDTDITSVDVLKTIIKDGKDGDSFKVTFNHAGETKTAVVKYPKELKTSNL